MYAVRNQSWYSHIKLKTKRIESKLKWIKFKTIKDIFFFRQNYNDDKIHRSARFRSTREAVIKLQVAGI